MPPDSQSCLHVCTLVAAATSNEVTAPVGMKDAQLQADVVWA